MHPHPDPSPRDDADGFEELLASSAPPITYSAQVRDDLQQMAHQARDHGNRIGVVPRFPRVGTAGVVLALSLGGVGVAAAATHDWEWLFYDRVAPEASYTYTAPSGAVCKTIIGVFRGSDPAALEVARDYASSTDLLAAVDVEKMLAHLQAGADQATYRTSEGREVAAGPGTKHFDADQQYDSAVGLAVTELLGGELERQGFDQEEVGINYLSELDCSEANG